MGLTLEDADGEEQLFLAPDEGDLNLQPEPATYDFFVMQQHVNLDINFLDKSIDGTTDIYIVTTKEKVEEVVLDAADCEIDTANVTITERREPWGDRSDGPTRNAAVEYQDPYSKLERPKNWRWNAGHHLERRRRAHVLFHNRKTDLPIEQRAAEGSTPVFGSLKISLKGRDGDRPKVIIRKSTSNLESAGSGGYKHYKITIPFKKKNPRDGYHFVGVELLDNRYTHMYTRHSTQAGTAACLFPCVDDHATRCSWLISIRFPLTLGDALQKPLASQMNGTSHHHHHHHDEGYDRNIDLAEEDKLREMTAVCSGLLVEESVDPQNDRKKIMTFEPERNHSVQKLGFAVGPFEHVDLSSTFREEEAELKLSLNALKVHAYCLPGREQEVLNTAAALTMAADHFTYTFAKYPFNNFKLCFLDDLVEDTTALHSIGFVSNRLLFPDEVIDTEVEVTRKIIYTLAYQWIGVNVVASRRNDLWLVIGIAHYMTDIVMKKLCGNNEHRFRMKQISDDLVRVDIGRPSLWDLGPNLYLGDFEMEFMEMKAPLVLFILDKRLLKASGSHGLTRILQKLLTKVQIDGPEKSPTLDTDKFRTLCEKPTRTRLESFWNQWVYGSGCPRFDVKAKFNKKRLCVELTLNQVQAQTVKNPELDKDEFLRLVKERRSGTAIGDVQPLFTGPMTIRIHEADGTPYEHILEIREDATRSTKFEIPYNTKYKRLKRTRRLKERHAGGANVEGAGDGADEALLYCLGDVLQTPEEQKQWELIDWDPDTERKMDQESYEWIRVDADFEWAADMKHTLEPYMYVSQLQQDRDVVAQQDAMLYLSQGPLHPIASGFLVRTLVDRRYFHGIRTMAARALTRQANIKDIPMLGLRQLMMAYREMFCFDKTNQPQPNNFTNKQQYKVRIAIIQAIAQVRDHTYRCPLEARQFILDQLLFNNNEGNEVSDHHWIALLVEAVATSLIPSKKDDWLTRQIKTSSDEERRFLEDALEQIERVLRRDEWTHSYQNIWTIAGLDAKQRLMKAEVIPKRPLDFGQYLMDGTADEIRVKCFEALVELGGLMDPQVFTFLLYVLSTDRSPWLRMKLIHVVSRGLAAIAFGEEEVAAPAAPPADDLDAGLVVQDDTQEIEARKERFARKENLDVALKALRKELAEKYNAVDKAYGKAMRHALEHRGLGRADVESLLDLATMMFEEAGEFIVNLNLPKAWKAQRVPQQLSKRVSFQCVDPFGERELTLAVDHQVLLLLQDDAKRAVPRTFAVCGRRYS